MIAYVATLLLESVMRLSRSTLQAATLAGCVKASVARVRVAANFNTALGEDKKSCKTLKARQSQKYAMYPKILTGYGFCKLRWSYISCLADCPGSLKVNHVALVTQPSLHQIKHLFLDT